LILFLGFCSYYIFKTNFSGTTKFGGHKKFGSNAPNAPVASGLVVYGNTLCFTSKLSDTNYKKI